MGLDIYLIYYSSLDLREKELEFQKWDEELWREITGGEFSSLSSSQQEARIEAYEPGLQKLAVQLDLKEFGPDQVPGYGHVRVLENSNLHPNHLFKIGYFRSSVGGFDAITHRLINKGLDWIFGPEALDDGIFHPDWLTVSSRAEKFHEKLAAALQKNIGQTTNEPSGEWCLEGCEIIIETCEFVFKSGEPEKYWLAWSH